MAQGHTLKILYLEISSNLGGDVKTKTTEIKLCLPLARVTHRILQQLL